MTTEWSVSSSNRRMRWLPTNPAPPVIRIVIKSLQIPVCVKTFSLGKSHPKVKQSTVLVLELPKCIGDVLVEVGKGNWKKSSIRRRGCREGRWHWGDP